MKLLPCRPSRGGGCGSFARASQDPYYLSTFPSTFRGDPYRYQCGKCKGTSEISLQQFNDLPEISAEDLAELGFHTWENSGLQQHESGDLARAGFKIADVKRLERRD